MDILNALINLSKEDMMKKYILIIIVLFLASCSNISYKENAIIDIDCNEICNEWPIQ